MIIAKYVIRIILVTVIPWPCRIVKRIIFITLSATTCHLGECLGAFSCPGSFSVFFEIREIGICAKVIGLQGKADMGQISRSGASGFIQGIFQLLNSTGDRVGRICDSVGLLRILRVISAF